ncbi:MAG: hypothetical protein WCT03_15630 [Candidatus Obscuribacterales bacterium]
MSSENENSPEAIVTPVKRPRLALELLLQAGLQLLCLAPFFTIYHNWPQFQSIFLPTLTLPAGMLQAVNGQLELAKIFAVVAATITAFYFTIVSPSKNGRLALVSAAVVGLLAQGLVMTRCLQFPLAIDDPFIDFRYVSNWINLRSFDYNPATQLTRVQGFSSPLHLFLLYVSSLAFRVIDVAKVSTGLNLLLQLTNLLLVYTVAAKSFKYLPLAWVAALLYTFGASSMLAGIDNKESTLVQLLILISLLLSSHRQWCPLISTLLSLTRPEGIIWFGREFICDIIERGKACIKPWIPALITLFVWYGFTYCYYGSAIPHGALGRSTMFHSFTHLTAHSCPFILTTVGIDVFHHLFLLPGGNGEAQSQLLTVENLLKGALAFLLLLYFARREKWLAGYAYNSVLLLLFFAIFDPWMFSWYYSWFSLIAVFTIPLLLQSAWSMLQSPNKVLIRVIGLALLGAVTVVQLFDLNMLNWSADKNSQDSKSISDYCAAQIHNTFFVVNPAIQRLALYKQAAEYLSSKGPNSETPSTLATWEPGVLGYYLPNTNILDLGGLVTNETLQYYPVPLNQRSRRDVWGSIPARAIIEMQPEKVIFFDGFADNGLLKNQRFLETYELSQFWPLELWGGHGLFLFEKQQAHSP